MAHWLFAFARGVAIIFGSIVIGVTVALALRFANLEVAAHALLRILGLETLFKGVEVFRNIDGLVADLVAASFTTGLTLYASVYLIQIREVRRQIKSIFETDLFGVDGFNLKGAIARERMDPVNQYSNTNPLFPLFICNTKVVLDKQLAAINKEKVVGPALAIELSQECSGESLIRGFHGLREQYGAKFKHVVLVDKVGSGHVTRGIARVEDLFQLLNPSLNPDLVNYEKNVGDALANLSVYPDPVVFEAYGFIVKNIMFRDSVGSMIRDLAHSECNSALAMEGDNVAGIADMWRLAKPALTK